MSILNQEIVRHQRDKNYEQLAKPGKDYSVYHNTHYQGEILFGEYRVEQVFQDKVSGFYALGLESISGENPPVLIIRGFGNWGRLEGFPTEFFPYNDIPDVILTESDRHFQAAKQLGVIEWLQNKAMKGMKAEVVGQSLGGKIGQQLAVECPDYIQSLVTFNSIGISAKEFDKYQGELDIFHYINPDDLFCYVLGEKFLPGTVFQVQNSTIKTYDFLGQHNKVVLDAPITLIEEVDIELFTWTREIYKSVKDYGIIIKKEVENLSQLVKKTQPENENALNNKSDILQHFEYSRRAIQVGFSQIKEIIRQKLVEKTDSIQSIQLSQKQINSYIQVIQKQVESLSSIVQEVKIKDSEEHWSNFSLLLQQELKDSIRTIQEKLDRFLQVETKLQEKGTLHEDDINSDRV